MSDPRPDPLTLQQEEEAAQALFAAVQGAPMPATLEARLLRAQSTQAAREREPLEAHRDDAWSFLLALLGDEPVARDALEEAFVRLARGEAEDLPAALGCAREAGLAAWALLCKAGRAETLGLLDGETRALVLLRSQGLDMDGLRRAGALPKQGDPLPTLSAAADALAAGLPAAGHPDGVALAALAARAALDPVGELGLVGPRELARLQEYETRAPAACAVLRARLEELTAVPFRVCPEAEALRARVAARLERERSHRAAVDAVAARVSLACTYCHAPMVRLEAAFCAACLAPHHADCFREHGRCSAPGCAETVSVRAGGTPARAPSRRRWALLLLGCVGATAALTAWELRRERRAERAWAVADATRQEAAELREALGRTMTDALHQKQRLEQERIRLEAELEALHKEQALGKAKLEALWERLRSGAKAGLGAEELVPWLEQGENAEARALEAKVEALFAEIFQAAEKREYEALIERFTLLRALMREAEGKPVLKVQLAKWNARLQELGELRLSILLQIYLNDGNQALRELAAAAQAGDLPEAEAAYARAARVVKDMRAEEREVFTRNADALAARAKELLAKAGKAGPSPEQEAQALEEAAAEDTTKLDELWTALAETPQLSLGVEEPGDDAATRDLLRRMDGQVSLIQQKARERDAAQLRWELDKLDELLAEARLAPPLQLDARRARWQEQARAFRARSLPIFVHLVLRVGRTRLAVLVRAAAKGDLTGVEGCWNDLQELRRRFEEYVQAPDTDPEWAAPFRKQIEALVERGQALRDTTRAAGRR